VWDLDSGAPALTVDAQHVVARFSPAGDCLVVGTPERFVCYETGSWSERWRVERPWTDALAGVIGFDPDGRFVAIGYTRYQVRLVGTAEGEEIVTLAGPDMHELNDALLSPDGRELVCTTVDRVIQRWRLDVLRSRLREIDPRLDLFARAR
jgi:WD40 repeat protein